MFSFSGAVSVLILGSFENMPDFIVNWISQF